MNFVNIHGDPVNVSSLAHRYPEKKAKTATPDEFHKGFRVVGLRPTDYEEAQRQRRIDIENARNDGRALPPELTLESWAARSSRKPVRSKPYELLEAARECKRLAEQAGWLFVEIVEIKRVKAAA